MIRASYPGYKATMITVLMMEVENQLMIVYTYHWTQVQDWYDMNLNKTME